VKSSLAANSAISLNSNWLGHRGQIILAQRPSSIAALIVEAMHSLHACRCRHRSVTGRFGNSVATVLSVTQIWHSRVSVLRRRAK
jgi:hypothetical protein